jgi:hypothetical protein
VQSALGAKGDGVTDDFNAIQFGIDVAGAMPLYFPPPEVAYMISQPLRLHAGTRLFGDAPWMWQPPGTYAPTPARQGPIIRALPTFTGQAMVTIFDQAISGDASQPAGVYLKGFVLDCAYAANAGIYWIGGGVIDNWVENVFVLHPATFGFQLEGRPGGLPIQTVILNNCTAFQAGGMNGAGHGFMLNGAGNGGCYDLSLFHCYALGTIGDGFLVTTHCASVYFEKCSAEWIYYSTTAGGNGFDIRSNDKITLDHCRTDACDENGIAIINATNPAGPNMAQGVLLRDCLTHGDGRRGWAGGSNGRYAGLLISGSYKVQVDGHNNAALSNQPDGNLPYRPIYGLSVQYGSVYQIDASWFMGVVAGELNDNTSTVMSGHYVTEAFPVTLLTDNPLTAVATTVNVGGVPSFDVGGGQIQIENERISYTAISGTSFTGCTRGASGTTAASHPFLAPVSGISSSTLFT